MLQIPIGNQTPITRIGVGVVSMFLFVGAPIAGYFLLQIVIAARATAEWPSVPGIIRSSSVDRTSTGRYFASIEYEYHIGDVDFVGGKIRASDGESNVRQQIDDAIAPYPSGQTVRVFYNPADPSQAYLKPGAGYQEYALLVVPLLMLAGGSWMSWRLWMTRPLKKV